MASRHRVPSITQPRARNPDRRNIFNALIYNGFVSSAERGPDRLAEISEFARRPGRDFGLAPGRTPIPHGRPPYRRARFSSHNRFVDRPRAALYHRLIFSDAFDLCPENARAFAAASLIHRYRLWTGEWFHAACRFSARFSAGRVARLLAAAVLGVALLNGAHADTAPLKVGISTSPQIEALKVAAKEAKAQGPT